MKWFQYSIFWRCLFKAFVSSKPSSFLKIFQALTYQVFPPPSLYFLVHDSFEASDSQIFFILVYSKQVERSQQILDTVADIQDFLSTLHVLKNDFFFSSLSSLRYSWDGQPLFITCPPANLDQDIPACSNCGSSRVFEFQLMPTLVSMLQSDSGAWLVWIRISKSPFWEEGSELQFGLFPATHMYLTTVVVLRESAVSITDFTEQRELCFVETLWLQLELLTSELW